MGEGHQQTSDLRSFSALVLVPAYNAGRYLPDLIPRLRAFVCDENLLVVNDGSGDDTESILDQLGVRHLTHTVNQGKGAALKTGFDYALKNGYRSVLTIDADLQHLPEEVPGFFARDDGNTIVIGTRTIHRSIMPFDRWLTNNLTSLIISVFSTQRVRDSQSGYRLIPTSALRAMKLRTVNYDFESEMLFKSGWLGISVAEVPIATVYAGSHSYINPMTDTLRFIRQIWKRIWV
ncbi:MAG: glycosyltransferase family 2 protein [candidate division Zixibacteria bacterium]|nr:glycosyltransferase family 2 protein [candidate division Zixibacteria bacterium]